MSASDAVMALVQSARGTRAYSMENIDAENALNIALALAVELASTNERIDRLERLLAQHSGMALDVLREQRFYGEAGAERQEAMEAMMARVLRILADPRQPVDGRVVAE